MTETEKSLAMELSGAAPLEETLLGETILGETIPSAPETPVKALDAQELLNIAQKAEEQAKNAALAADEAGQAARSTLSASPEEGNPDDTFLEAKILLAQQAAKAAEAALKAQTGARDAAAAAIYQAETDTSLALAKAEAARLEVERLSQILEQADESALYAREAAAEAAKIAEEKANKKEAVKKALEAARLMAEDNQKKHEASFNILKTSREKAVEATARLNEIHNKAITAQAAAESLFKRDDTDKTPEQPPKKSLGKRLWGYLKLLVMAFIIALLLRSYVFEIAQVSGGSMLPYMHDGDNLIISKISYFQAQPQRGDIIILDAPDKSGEFYVKRIIGLPNEHIAIKEGSVFIDGKVLEEPYLVKGNTKGEISQIIEKDSFFILGDNRDESHDSRDPAVGTVLKASIRGKAVFRVYPWDSLGFINN